ncbi:uncharacterized protein TRIADDRAFT_24944 [Trichoplax adhaerens]|uniref:Uncharacterized protein n=1 Tax=Trichoplax adhaerens TaxID=10228 RepID=B3RXF9_TRIAD|nr:hypothetical protein TRIADDRAFT_24944 [Trichoplax adhaerens]EDV24859.1 hypothetical protein TRIADDRAFT_24944 [Trichoplax adhaerens]|eukprot:XP_002112749.1 hypothetical protein TRIADDRAFT_24944 [Trichoplax adhaerens]
MVVSPDRNVSSESVEKPQSNKRKATSVLDVDVYADDIHSYLRKAEYFHRPKYDYMERQCDVNGTMRSILVDWLVEVSEEYKLRERTLYLAISYIDRFLSAMSVRRSKLQLVGTAALFIAAKFQEIYPPDCAEFAYITDDTYNIKQVLKMESLMLKVLSFNLSSPTAVDFLERYGSEAGLDSEIRELSMYLTELTLKDYGFLQFMPSLIAVSAVSLALHTFKLKYWPQELSTYTNYQWQQVSPCLNRIFEAFRLAHTQPQRAVVEKYKSPR